MKYSITIHEEDGDPSARDSDGNPEPGLLLLTLRVDELHELAPKLAALYPPPKVKRSHRRKAEVTS